MEYSENYCLATLITNLKHRKRYPDAMTVADCAKNLYNIYSSYDKIAQMVGVSPSVIRKWVNLSNTTEAIRAIVRDGKVYPISAFAILSAFRDISKREEIFKQVSGWGEPEIIGFLKFLKQNPSVQVVECKQLFMVNAIKKTFNNT